MKNLLVLLARISVLLLAAAVVVGITMRFVDTNTTNRFTPNERAVVSQADSAEQSAATTSANEEREFRGERHGPRNQPLASRLTFGLFGLVKNSAIIAVIVLLAVRLERFWTRRWNRATV